MRKTFVLACLFFLFATLSHANAKAPVVVLETSMGAIHIEMNPGKAPVTVANFLKYVRSGHYNGTVFHRVIPNFMIQGGGLTANMTKKKSRAPIKNEADNGLTNIRGSIAMARTSAPHSASAQFFINVKNNPFLNHRSKTMRGWGYCVFGQVVKGMDVVDKIRYVRTTMKNFRRNVPVQPITITRSYVQGEQKPAARAAAPTKVKAPAARKAAPNASFASIPKKTIVELDTTMGKIQIELYRNLAPATTSNFIEYVNAGFYNGTVFHRVIPNFMIQGGGLTTNMTKKKTRAPIKNEADNSLKNERGTVAMARTSAPHSATAQFFINVKSNPFLNHRSKTLRGWGYCVFGKVVKGLDIVDKIRYVKTSTKGYRRNVPVQPVIIRSARLLR